MQVSGGGFPAGKGVAEQGRSGAEQRSRAVFALDCFFKSVFFGEGGGAWPRPAVPRTILFPCLNIHSADCCCPASALAAAGPAGPASATPRGH